MGKSVNDAVLDASLDEIAASTELTICEGEPTTYEEANSEKGTGAGKVLARVTLNSGDFTKANGDVSGRKVTVAGQLGLTVLQTGNGDHIALNLVSGTRLNYVTTAPLQAISSGGTVDVQAWDIEIEDPS